jgi:predicted nucleic acid-binding protein
MSGRHLLDTNIIVAIAKQHSLTVVTRDQHFTKIDGLDLEQW